MSLPQPKSKKEASRSSRYQAYLIFHLNQLKTVLIFTTLLLFSFSCVFQTKKGDFLEKTNKPEKPSVEDNKSIDEGDFLVQHESAQKEELKKYEKEIRSDKILEKAADKLNRSLSLPQNVLIKTKECGEANSFYDTNKKEVILCFEMIEYFNKLFQQEGYSSNEAKEKSLDAMKFVFLHEISHALIDVYQLPITGNEEDAADRLSSIICLEKLGEEGVKSVLAAADAFRIEAKNKHFKSRNLLDEHLLQEERAFISLCMIYGSDPNKYSYLTKKYLPADRTQTCFSEYEKVLKGWTTLLEKWRKD